MFKVELSAGNRTTVSKSGTRGIGSAFSEDNGEDPFGLALHAGAAYMVNSYFGLKALVRVDLSTGNCDTMSKSGASGADGFRGSGVVFSGQPNPSPLDIIPFTTARLM